MKATITVGGETYSAHAIHSLEADGLYAVEQLDGPVDAIEAMEITVVTRLNDRASIRAVLRVMSEDGNIEAKIPGMT